MPKSSRKSAGGRSGENGAPELPDDWTWIIGEVVGVFGLRGEMKVRLETDFPDRFSALKKVCLRPSTGKAEILDVRGARLHKGHVLLSLAGIDRIEDAERWRGAKVQIPRGDAVPLPENSFYAADIVGFDIVTRDGRGLGKLDSILPYPAHDLFQAGEILIPAVKEFVLEVDTPNRRIVVDPPAGLLPGDAPETVE